MRVFKVGDTVAYKNANKYGVLEHLVTALAVLHVELDGHNWVPTELLVHC